jgi:hypothetical protein
MKDRMYFGEANKTLVEGADTNPVKKELKEKDEEMTMSAFNLKAIPEDAKGLKKMAKSEKGAEQVKEFGYDPATAMKSGFQMAYKMVNKEGFQMAGKPAMYQEKKKKTGNQGGGADQNVNVETKIEKGGTETNYSGGGRFKNKEERKWYEGQIKQRMDKGMSQEEAIQDYRNTFKIGEKKETQLPDIKTTEVTPIYETKDVFNIQDQRMRGQQSLLAGRQSRREGLDNLISQKRGLKTALKSALDQGKISRKDKRKAMRSFRRGNFTGLQSDLVNKGVTDLRGFDAGQSTLSRRQATGIDRSNRYYQTQDMLNRGLRAGSQFQGVQDTSFGEANLKADQNPFSATNQLLSLNNSLLQDNKLSGLNIPGMNMGKPFQMKANPFQKKYKK